MMDPQNQYYYGHERPTMPQQDPAFSVNSIEQNKMGPMMRALTEDFDLGGQQNSVNSYPQQRIPSMQGVPNQPRMPSDNFGPASQTLSSYASQYSTGPSSQNYFGQGHQQSPRSSGFSSPGGNYPPPAVMNSPYQRQMPVSSPVGSPNGHGHSFTRSNSAGPLVPSPVMMHSQGMNPYNQNSPGNRPNAPFSFPPSSPHNNLNHASPPLTSPSGMRPGGNLQSPKSAPAGSPVAYPSQMSPQASRPQSMPSFPGNGGDHFPTRPHSRSKSPGSAGIHRPYPQQVNHPQPLYPLPSPKVRPVDQTDSRGQYVELVHSKPPGEQWTQNEQMTESSRNNSGQRRVSDPGHLPRLEEMVAVLGDSNIKESLDEIVSDKNLMFDENGDMDFKSSEDCSNQNAQSSNSETRTQKNGARAMSNSEGISNGYAEKGDVVNGGVGPTNCLSDVKSEDDFAPVKPVTKTYSGKASANKTTNAPIDVNSEHSNNTNDVKTNIVNETVFKPSVETPSKPQTSIQTKEEVESEPLKDQSNVSESKCQNTLPQHSVENSPALSVPSTSTPCTSRDTPVPQVQTPPLNNPMITPTSKKNSPEDSGSGTGDSLPLKKRRGRPVGSRSKQEGEEPKPKRKYTRKKKIELDNDPRKEVQNLGLSKEMGMGKSENRLPVVKGPSVKGPVLRLQGSSLDRVVSCQIVNTPDAPQDDLHALKSGKHKNRPKKVIKHTSSKRQNIIVSGSVGSAAILSTECSSPTGLWVCALCGMPPNFGDLGDLYGPYHPPGTDVSSGSDERSAKRDSTSRGERQRSAQAKDWHHRSKDIRGWLGGSSCRGQGHEPRNQRGKSLMAKQAELGKNKKWRQVKTYMDEMGIGTGRRCIKRRHSSSGEAAEMWIHEECAVWSQGVIFFQGHLYGIHEAVTEAENKKCNQCRDPGASVGCVFKGCKQVYHFLCAIEAECLMQVENYSMTCPKHKDKRVKIRGGP